MFELYLREWCYEKKKKLLMQGEKQLYIIIPDTCGLFGNKVLKLFARDFFYIFPVRLGPVLEANGKIVLSSAGVTKASCFCTNVRQ